MSQAIIESNNVLTDYDFPTGRKGHQPNHPKILRLKQFVEEHADEYDEADKQTERRQFRGRQIRSKSTLLTLFVDEVKPGGEGREGRYMKIGDDGVTWVADLDYNDSKLRTRVSNCFNNYLKARNRSKRTAMNKVNENVEQVTNNHNIRNGDGPAVAQFQAIPNLEEPTIASDRGRFEVVQIAEPSISSADFGFNVATCNLDDVSLLSSILKDTSLDSGSIISNYVRPTGPRKLRGLDEHLQSLDEAENHLNRSSRVATAPQVRSAQRQTNNNTIQDAGRCATDTWANNSMTSDSRATTKKPKGLDDFLQLLDEADKQNNRPSNAAIATEVASIEGQSNGREILNDVCSEVGTWANSSMASGSTISTYARPPVSKKLKGLDEHLQWLDEVESHINRPSSGAAATGVTATKGKPDNFKVQNDGFNAVRSRAGVSLASGNTASKYSRALASKNLKGLDEHLRRLEEAEKQIQSPSKAAIATVVTTMQDQPDDCKVQKDGCATLGTWANDHPPAQSEIASAGGITVVMAAMLGHSDNSEVQAYGCYAISHLAFHHSLNQTVITSAGGITIVMAAMRCNFNDAEVQRYGCDALGQLACNHLSNQSVIVSAGGIEVALAAMQCHSNDSEVQKDGCRLLCQLAYCHSSNQTLIVSSGGIPCVMAAMQGHANNSEVQRYGCHFFCNLAENHPSNKTAIASVGGMHLLMAAMHGHSNDSEVQKYGCIALGNLADNHESNQTTIVSAGGIAVVTAAMQGHSTIAEVQRNGSFALGNLADSHPVNQTEIASAGGIVVVIVAMQDHHDDGEVQKDGCIALGQLTRDHSSNHTLLVSAGGIAVVTAAMQDHLDDEEVQRYGYFALGKRASCDDLFDPTTSTSACGTGVAKKQRQIGKKISKLKAVITLPVNAWPKKRRIGRQPN